MNRLCVLIVGHGLGKVYLGYFVPVLPFMYDLDGSILTLEQLKRFHLEMIDGLSKEEQNDLRPGWVFGQEKAKLSFTADGWVLKLGDVSYVSERIYLEELVENMGNYLDRNLVTSENASDAILTMKENYQPETG